MTAQSEFDFNAPPKAESKPATAAILAKIKKLLRLGSNPAAARGEAEAAMRMAYELAERFRVDLAALDLDEETRRVIDERWHIGARYDTLRRGIFGILRVFFHVSTCRSSPAMVVVGKPADLAIARYVYDFLLRAGRRALRVDEEAEKRARRRMTLIKRTSFLQGFCYGIIANLQKTEKQLALGDAHAALMVVEEKERDAHLETAVGPMVPMKQRKTKRNGSAVMRGFAEGLSTSINQPLNGGHREAPLALPA